MFRWLPLLFLLLTRTLAAMATPNIVVLLADDQGWGDLSRHGNINLQTPNLDALGRGGAVFDRFYVCPVCAPTRAEFLTGRYHARGGVRGVSTGQERLNLDERTLAEVLRKAGYATGAFGKWHNGSQWPYHPNARGFGVFYGFTSGHWGEYFNPPLEHNGRPVRGQGYIADGLTTHALEFITEHRAGPFFCYVPFNTPHSPFCVPEEYWQRSATRPLALTATEAAREDLPSTRCALAMCENLDANVARVLHHLEELGLRENTIVIYFSDNGPATHRWNGGMKGIKGSVDEGGVRVPLMIQWPGHIPAGLQVREIAGAIDLLPTLTALAGVPLPEGKPLDGVDLSPLLLGKTTAWPDRKIFSQQNNKVSVRTQRWRLDERGGLFDMAAYPGQQAEVGAQHPEIKAELQRTVTAWRAEVAPKGKDERPYPVGYPEFPATPLPARDGVAHGGILRSAPAPNCSYFTNWKLPTDTMTWDVEVHTTGEYRVSIDYTAPAAGSTVELSFRGSTLRGVVGPAWDPPLITGEDRVPRKAESLMKEFHPLELGRMHLEQGHGELSLRAVEIVGGEVMDVRRMTLTLLPPP